MCACMCFVYVYTWICIHMERYTCGYAGIYRCMCVFVSAWLYMHVNVHVYMWKGCTVLMHVSTHMYSHTCTHIYMCACVTMLFFTDNSSCLVVMGTTVLKMWIPLHVGQRKQKREGSVTNTSRAPKAKAENHEFRSRQSQLSGVQSYTQDTTIVSGPFPASFLSVMVSGYLLTSFSSVNWSEQWINL